MHLPGPILRAACLGLFLLATGAHGQHESRWYKVELLVVTHEGAPGDEQFEPTPELAYPENHRFLLHPQQLRARVKQHEGPARLDSRGRLTLMPPPTEPGSPDIPLQGPPASAQADTAPTDPNAVAGPPRPTPFIALPAARREFRGKAAYMEQTGEYRVLFHEVWAQPVMGKQRAVPLVLDRSGDSGSWPELQGSITLHVARYLHLETRLWLNTMGEYLPGNWRMPAAPLGPPSVITVAPERPGWNAAPEPNEAAGGGTIAVYESDELPEDGIAAEGPESSWRHAVLLEQRRRMRSLEVHYLDHPRLSAVIKLEPLDEEQLEAMAAAEEPILPPAQD